jgi:hypothetical protein
MFFFKYALVIYVAMCCQSLATHGCIVYINVHHTCALSGRAGEANHAGGEERALQTNVCTRFQF